MDEKLMVATSNVVSAYLKTAKEPVAPSELDAMICRVAAALKRVRGESRAAGDAERLAEAGLAAAQTAAVLTPAVPIEDSVHPDYIVCLEDGVKLKMLKRHLRTRFNLSPEQYRCKWRLPKTYPMVAPNYSAVRRRIAAVIGIVKRG